MEAEVVHLLSLGAGVQSSVIGFMASYGLISPGVACAIFADTHAEPPSVYEWLDWLETQFSFPVIRADKGDLEQDSLVLRASKKTPGNIYSKSLIPLFMLGPNGEKGMLSRRCTRDYKIYPIQRTAKRIANGRNVIQWIGISTDEAHRMKDSGVDWITNRYPLIEAGMSRSDCIAWMKDHKLPEPPRSACYFCPYHSDREWLRLQFEEPDVFARAVEYEKKVQKVVSQDNVTHGTPFLHSARIPLDQVDFANTKQDAQLNLFGNECEGMCGV